MKDPEVIKDPTIVGNNHRLTVYEPEILKYHNPILAIHGMWGTGKRWENYGRFFSSLGFRFLAPDLRHHCSGNQNFKDFGKTSVNDYVNDIAELIGTLIAPPIVFGHSMGGLIAQKLASQKLAYRLVLLNSAPPAGVSLHANLWYQLQTLRYLPKMLLKKPFKLSRKLADYYLMNEMPESERRRCYHRMVHESAQAAWEIKFGKIEVDFEKIDCPALIIGCEKDRIVPSLVAEDIAKKITHPGYDLWTYPQFAHWIQAEPGWKYPANHIFEWLKTSLE